LKQSCKISALGISCLLFLLATALFAQVPPRLSGYEPGLDAAQLWRQAGAYHAIRQELEKVFPHLKFVQEKRDALVLLMESTFEDQEYEDAFRWSGDFLKDFPNDGERGTSLFIRGVSAFQTRRLEIALSYLDEFLGAEPRHTRAGEGYFWRAMCKLDMGRGEQAEEDVKHCYLDSSSENYHDIALMGWALSLERRGQYRTCEKLLEELVVKFPASSLMPEVKIRLASLSMRRGDPGRCSDILSHITPPSRLKEEYLLLLAESDQERRKFENSRSEYLKFTVNFPESPYYRGALFSAAFADLALGRYGDAMTGFDSLSRGNDSLALAALYQSAVLSLLENNTAGAMAKFDTLTSRSPYDAFAENAYIQMGMTRYRLKHYREARRFFQLAARMFPESRRRPGSYRMLGEASLAMGDFSNAQYAFAQVKRLGGPPDILAPSMFQEGVCLYHLGRFKSSAEVLSDFLRTFPKDPRSAEVSLWKGEALYQDYRFEEAERVFAEAVRMLPDGLKRASAAYGYAWSLFEQKKFSQAASAFEKFTFQYKGDNRSLDASLRKADCYFFMGQYEKAREMYAQLESSKTDRGNVEYAAFQVAMSYIQRGESQRGIEQLRNFLVRFPSSVYNEVVQFNIGWEYFSKEQYAESLPELRAVMLKYPESQLIQRVLFNMGDAFYNLKQYDSSRVYYLRLIREYPSSLLVPDALNGLQFTYEAQGKPRAALAQLDTILGEKTVSTPREELLLRKGDILFGQGDFGGAAVQYQNVLTMKPARSVQAKALHQLGRAYEMENNPARAAAYYAQVFEDFSDAETAPASAVALGILQTKARQYGEAVSTFEKFALSYQDSPLLAEAEYYHGVALAALADKRAAFAQFQSVISRYPENVFADRGRIRLATLLSDRKDYRSSLDTLTSVVSRRSDDIAAEALIMIGENYLSMKRYTDALQAFNDCIRQYTDFPLMVDRARMGLAGSYEKLRDRKRARTAYEEASKSAVDPKVRKDAAERLKRLKK